MRPRKLVIGGIVTVIVLGIGFIGVKATISPNSAPQPVTQAKQEIVPNHVYQSYRYPYKLTIVRPAAKLYSRPAGTRGCQYLGTVHSRHVTAQVTGQIRDDLNHNQRAGYIRFTQNHHHYWISAQETRFRDLASLKAQILKLRPPSRQD